MIRNCVKKLMALNWIRKQPRSKKQKTKKNSMKFISLTEITFEVHQIMLNSIRFHIYLPIKWNFSEIIVSQFQNLIELNVHENSPIPIWSGALPLTPCGCCCFPHLFLRCGAAVRSSPSNGDDGDDRHWPTATLVTIVPIRHRQARWSWISHLFF